MLTKHIFNVSINEILPGISEMVQQSFLYHSRLYIHQTYSHYIQPELFYLYSILDVP